MLIRSASILLACGALLGTVACSTGNTEGAPSEYRGDVERLTRVFAAFDSVGQLTRIPPGQEGMTTTPEHDALVYAQLELGIATGDSISNAFLDWLHPEMRQAFREQFVGGNRAYLDGLRTENAARQVEGIERIGMWYGGFWVRHKATITDKALGS